MDIKKLKNDFYWVGTLDPNLKIFDIVMDTEFGTSYNSYLLCTSVGNVLFDCTKETFYDEYVERLKAVTDLSDIKYLVVNHTEPDHAGGIARLLKDNPDITVVATQFAIRCLKEIVNLDFKALKTDDGGKLELGNKTLRFIHAPNLHWPDTMFTYIENDKILVTCDMFGAHYCADCITLSAMSGKDKTDFMGVMEFYFAAIMAPFKEFVLSGIDKIKDIDIDMIAAGHGPVLDSGIDEIVETYRHLASVPVKPDKKMIVVAYGSAYGYTRALKDAVVEGIRASGDIDTRVYDLEGIGTDKKAELMADLEIADGVLFGSPTFVGEAIPPVWDVLIGMLPRIYSGRPASAFGSFGWSGEAVPHIIQRLEQLKMEVYGEGFRKKFKPMPEDLEEAKEFGKGFGTRVLEK